MPQGRCTLPADPSGRALDRLAGLEKVIRPEQVRQALAAAGCTDSRPCVLTHEVMLWVVLAMSIFTDVPIRQVFKLSRRLRPDEPTPHRSSLCVARRRLGVAPVRALFGRVARPLAHAGTPGAFAFGLRLMGIDGTVYDVPDTHANAAAFGRPSGNRGDGAFPQARKLSLVELGTHAEVGLEVGPLCRGERTMAAGLLGQLGPGMLLLLDSGLFSRDLWRKLVLRPVEVLARVTTQMVLRPTRVLADGSYLSKLYRTEYDRRMDRGGLAVRVIRYTLDDPRRPGHGREHVLLTTLVDGSAYPAIELILLYHERWEHEITFDEQKTHQDPRRPGKPARLRSETPAGVTQEIYALSLGHYVVRSLMLEAAAAASLDPDRLSFAGCLQILRCRLPECDAATPAGPDAWHRGLLREIGQERTGRRRNRINPRVIKKQVSNWRRKRPADRGLPPLTKTFRETVVMLR
jgi:hypothetical protein